MDTSFLYSIGFGRGIEYNLVGKMLIVGLYAYLLLVDDHVDICIHHWK